MESGQTSGATVHQDWWRGVRFRERTIFLQWLVRWYRAC